MIWCLLTTSKGICKSKPQSAPRGAVSERNSNHGSIGIPIKARIAMVLHRTMCPSASKGNTGLATVSRNSSCPANNTTWLSIRFVKDCLSSFRFSSLYPTPSVLHGCHAWEIYTIMITSTRCYHLSRHQILKQRGTILE